MSLEGERSVVNQSNIGHRLLLVQENRLLREFDVSVYLVCDLHMFEWAHIYKHTQTNLHITPRRSTEIYIHIPQQGHAYDYGAGSGLV